LLLYGLGEAVAVVVITIAEFWYCLIIFCVGIIIFTGCIGREGHSCAAAKQRVVFTGAACNQQHYG
jgi:hypothetical protein